MKNVQRLTYGAILLAIFAVILLITLYIPILGSVINLFMALPFILFTAKTDRKGAIVFLVAAILISLIVGTILAVPLTLTYGLTGVFIGDFIRERKSQSATYIAASFVFLVNVVVQYIVAIFFFKINFVKQSIDLMRESLDMAIKMMTTLDQKPNQRTIERLEAIPDLIQTLTPSLLVMLSFTAVLLIILVNVPIAKRFGVEMEGSQKLKDFSLPKSLTWYYLFTLIASIVFKPGEGSYWSTALLNLAFILQLLMIVQGVAFIFYISHKKEFPKAVPVVVTILLFFVPILLYIVSILGIIDLGFDLRKRILEK